MRVKTQKEEYAERLAHLKTLEPRGIKMWAVVAISPRWKKPRFVWDGKSQRLIVYTTPSRAYYVCVMHSGQPFICDGKQYRVNYSTQPVWIETMGRPVLTGHFSPRASS